MYSNTVPASASGTRITSGPPLWIPIAAYAVLAVVAVVVYPAGGPMTTLDALRASPIRGDVTAMLVVAAAAPLAVWVAAVVHRLWTLGVRVAGTVIGLMGGVMAVSALLVSGLAAWTATTVATSGDATSAPAAVLASTLSFAAGGVGFALGSGLLLAGIAVPAGLLRLVPRWFAIVGVVLAVCGALAPLGLLTSALYPLLPIVRFGSLLWFIAAAFLLPVPGRARAPA